EPGLSIPVAVGGEGGAADRDVPEIRVLWVDRLGPGVVPVEAMLVVAPGLAPILRAGDALAGRLVDALRRERVGQKLVGVAVGLGVVIAPCCAAVARAHHAAQLDPYSQPFGVGRVKGDRADVVCPGARREGPLR